MIHLSFIGYMLALAIIMIVSVIAYRLLVETKVRPSVNRFILLSLYAISFIVPLLATLFPESQNEAAIEIGNFQYVGLVEKRHCKSRGILIKIIVYNSLDFTNIFHWIIPVVSFYSFHNLPSDFFIKKIQNNGVSRQ